MLHTFNDSPISPGQVAGLILEAFSCILAWTLSKIKTDAVMQACPANPAKETTISDTALSVSQPLGFTGKEGNQVILGTTRYNQIASITTKLKR